MQHQFKPFAFTEFTDYQIALLNELGKKEEWQALEFKGNQVIYQEGLESYKVMDGEFCEKVFQELCKSDLDVVEYSVRNVGSEDKDKRYIILSILWVEE